ncbi:MAG: SpoIID/LytB domain-containing protein [Tyzzerella sp.]|nr:SpoIID/LytB domain-containing protein [Tyzzerella sp.]
MRKKDIYIVAAVLLAALFIVTLFRILFENQGERQKIKESELPKIEKNLTNDSEAIRVVIKTNGFAQIAHPEVQLQAESGLKISYGDIVTECEADQIVTISPGDERFQAGTIRVDSRNDGEKITIASLQRGYGAPSYRGKLELFQTSEGIVIVNELLLEEYLYAVVPSEMPASYELEALKAQAVCARSYAYNQSRDYAYPEYQAHVDDSTSFQVYGNSAEQESTIRAVNETCGEKVWYCEQVATTYYYSTSCGKSASITAWGSGLNESNQYLQSIEICNEKGEAYEATLPWYRWIATVPEQTMSDLIELNTKTEIGNLLALTITKTGDGGIVQEITAVGTTGKVIVETENKIRSALGGSGYTIEKQDGKIVNSSKLLPSAFFTVEKQNGNYVIRGGGYGHGIGMSQNGANEMAKQGKNYQQILTTFYTGVTVK